MGKLIDQYLATYGLELAEPYKTVLWEEFVGRPEEKVLEAFCAEFFHRNRKLRIKKAEMFGGKFNSVFEVEELPDILLYTEGITYYPHNKKINFGLSKYYLDGLVYNYGHEKTTQILKWVDKEYELKCLFDKKAEDEWKGALKELNQRIERFSRKLNRQKKSNEQFKEGLLQAVIEEQFAVLHTLQSKIKPNA